jgi:hypothetical protein
MIPKILHFIWLGENEPPTVKFTIDAFKKANPDFKINFIRETSVKDAKNEDVKEVLKLINSTSYNPYRNCYFYGTTKEILSKSKIFFYTKFANALRHFLLDKYGGIYLDCDTFPVKPFDEKLLSYDAFRIARTDNNNEKICCCDIEFIGKNPNLEISSVFCYCSDKFKVKHPNVKCCLLNYEPMFLPAKKNIFKNYSELLKKYRNMTIEYGKDFYNSGELVYINIYERIYNSDDKGWWCEVQKIKKELASQSNMEKS